MIFFYSHEQRIYPNRAQESIFNPPVDKNEILSLLDLPLIDGCQMLDIFAYINFLLLFRFLYKLLVVLCPSLYFSDLSMLFVYDEDLSFVCEL